MIEFATHARAADAAELAASRAPAPIRRAINRRRLDRGLRPIVSADDLAALDDKMLAEAAAARQEASRPGVWLNGPRGSLIPFTGKASPPAAVGRQPNRGPLVDRVLLVVAHGDARGCDIGRPRNETIMRGAFGPAATLNAERGWGLTHGHGSPLIAFGGPGQHALRAHDTDVGLVLEWEPDTTRPDHQAAVRAIQAGAGASVLMRIAERSTLGLREPIDVVHRARLISVAITPKPAYRGSVAALFPASRAGDLDELERQIAATCRKARERARWTGAA